MCEAILDYKMRPSLRSGEEELEGVGRKGGSCTVEGGEEAKDRRQWTPGGLSFPHLTSFCILHLPQVDKPLGSPDSNVQVSHFECSNLTDPTLYRGE